MTLCPYSLFPNRIGINPKRSGINGIKCKASTRHIAVIFDIYYQQRSIGVNFTTFILELQKKSSNYQNFCS